MQANTFTTFKHRFEYRLSAFCSAGAPSFITSFTVGLLPFLLLVPGAFGAQKKSSAAKPKGTLAAKPKAIQTKPTDELTKLRDEFIKATNDYQALLKKQLPGLEKNVARAQDQLTKLSQLFAEGLISKKELEASERALGQAKDKVTEINQAIANADSRIADTLLEAEAERTLAKIKPIPRGGLVSTAAMIRFNGGSAWRLVRCVESAALFPRRIQKTPSNCSFWTRGHSRSLAPRPPQCHGRVSPSRWPGGTGVAKLPANKWNSFPGISPGDPGHGYRTAYSHRAPIT